MFLLFSALGVLWTIAVIKGGSDSHKIHYLMIVLVAFKSLTVLSQVGRHPQPAPRPPPLLLLPRATPGPPSMLATFAAHARLSLAPSSRLPSPTFALALGPPPPPPPTPTHPPTHPHPPTHTYTHTHTPYHLSPTHAHKTHRPQHKHARTHLDSRMLGDLRSRCTMRRECRKTRPLAMSSAICGRSQMGRGPMNGQSVTRQATHAPRGSHAAGRQGEMRRSKYDGHAARSAATSADV